MPYCPICGTANREGSTFCNGCGTRLSGKERICGACGTRNTPLSRFCHSCGNPFSEEPVLADIPATPKPVSEINSDIPDALSLGDELPTLEAEIPAELLFDPPSVDYRSEVMSADSPISSVSQDKIFEVIPAPVEEFLTARALDSETENSEDPPSGDQGLPTTITTQIASVAEVTDPIAVDQALAPPEWLDIPENPEIPERLDSLEEIELPNTPEQARVIESDVSATEQTIIYEPLPAWLDTPEPTDISVRAGTDFASEIEGLDLGEPYSLEPLPAWLDLEESDEHATEQPVLTFANQPDLLSNEEITPREFLPDWLDIDDPEPYTVTPTEATETFVDTSSLSMAEPAQMSIEETLSYEEISIDLESREGTSPELPPREEHEQESDLESQGLDHVPDELDDTVPPAWLVSQKPHEEEERPSRGVENLTLPEWLDVAEKQEGMTDLQSALDLPVPVFTDIGSEQDQFALKPISASEEAEGVSPFAVEEIPGSIESFPGSQDEAPSGYSKPDQKPHNDRGDEGPGLTQGIALSRTFQHRASRESDTSNASAPPIVENHFSGEDSGTDSAKGQTKPNRLNPSRFIPLILLIAVSLPFFFPLGLAVGASSNTVSAYQTLNQVPDNSTVLVSFDWDGTTNDEMTPIAVAILEHLASKNVKVIAVSLVPEGGQLAHQVLERLEKHDYKYGSQFVNLGYLAGEKAVIQSIVKGFSSAFRQDHYGAKLDTLPLTRQVLGVRDTFLFISLAGNPERMQDWVTQLTATSPSTRIVGGITALGAPTAQPFVQSKQILGLVSGLPGAAEYEWQTRNPGLGSATVDAQSIAHMVLILLILGANVSVFIRRTR